MSWLTNWVFEQDHSGTGTEGGKKNECAVFLSLSHSMRCNLRYFQTKQEVASERLPSSRAAGSQSPPSGGTSWSVVHAFPVRQRGRSSAGRSSRPWCRASGSGVWRPPASDTALYMIIVHTLTFNVFSRFYDRGGAAQWDMAAYILKEMMRSTFYPERPVYHH